ncbi:MAG: DNA gyrase inhibitor YacG [Alphaproteobacteria bacterium]|nr:DNA gyrase inhibitor YacG [Alphaproteobacteria bacterium SS10]
MSKAKCPTCGKPTVHQFRPFCSKRCAQLDLAKWLNEDYAIPVGDEAAHDGQRRGDERPRQPANDDGPIIIQED